VAGQIEGIAPCIGRSAVELTFPLNTAKGSKLSFAAMAGDQVISQDGIQLPCSPLSVALGGMLGSCPKFSPIHASSFPQQPHPRLVQQRLPDLPPATAGTAGDPRWNVPEVR
jgi:hypothetical protein